MQEYDQPEKKGARSTFIRTPEFNAYDLPEVNPEGVRRTSVVRCASLTTCGFLSITIIPVTRGPGATYTTEHHARCRQP